MIVVNRFRVQESDAESFRTDLERAHQILAVQAVMLAASLVFMRPLAYLVWIGSWSTLWSRRCNVIANVVHSNRYKPLANGN